MVCWEKIKNQTEMKNHEQGADICLYKFAQIIGEALLLVQMKMVANILLRLKAALTNHPICQMVRLQVVVT